MSNHSLNQHIIATVNMPCMEKSEFSQKRKLKLNFGVIKLLTALARHCISEDHDAAQTCVDDPCTSIFMQYVCVQVNSFGR